MQYVDPNLNKLALKDKLGTSTFSHAEITRARFTFYPGKTDKLYETMIFKTLGIRQWRTVILRDGKQKRWALQLPHLWVSRLWYQEQKLKQGPMNSLSWHGAVSLGRPVKLQFIVLRFRKKRDTWREPQRSAECLPWILSRDWSTQACEQTTKDWRFKEIGRGGVQCWYSRVLGKVLP